MRNISITFILLSAFCMKAYCQDGPADSTQTSLVLEPYHWNVIKFNPTPMLLFGEVRNVTFSYERLIKKNQSLVLQAGYLTFPNIMNDTIAKIINFTGNSGHKGMNLALDYRYYPSVRNRRPAPDGLYVGGYAVYYGFWFENSFDILNTEIDQSVEINGRYNILNLGLDLGYQFVFWKRLTIDLLLIGPSLNLTQGKIEINGDLDPDEIAEIDDEVVDKLIGKFPLLTQVFSEESLIYKGSRSDFGIGFRYSFQIGFHF